MAAAYVKWVEMAGARAVPIRCALAVVFTTTARVPLDAHVHQWYVLSKLRPTLVDLCTRQVLR